MLEKELLSNKDANLRDRIISEAAESIVFTEVQDDGTNFMLLPNTEQAVQILNRVSRLQPLTIYHYGHITSDITYDAQKTSNGDSWSTSLYVHIPVDVLQTAASSPISEVVECTLTINNYYVHSEDGTTQYMLYLDVKNEQFQSLFQSEVDLKEEGIEYVAPSPLITGESNIETGQL